MSKEFYETRKLFRSYLDYTSPYSFEEWNSLPTEKKAAALYVQYFDQILLSWYKSKSFYASEQEAVETVCQYLVKNVPLIEKSPKKFTPNYIYRVSYNCLYCISHDRISDKLRYELEVSNICEASEDELDMFDFIPDDHACEGYDIDMRITKSQLWKVIDSDPEFKAIVDNILNGQKCNIRGKQRTAVIERLKVELVKYSSVFYD